MTELTGWQCSRDTSCIVSVSMMIREKSCCLLCRFIGCDWWLCCSLERSQRLGQLTTRLYIPRLWRNIQLEWTQLVSDAKYLGVAESSLKQLDNLCQAWKKFLDLGDYKINYLTYYSQAFWYAVQCTVSQSLTQVDQKFAPATRWKNAWLSGLALAMWLLQTS